MVRRAFTRLWAWVGPHLSDGALIDLHTLRRDAESGASTRDLQHVQQCEWCSSRFEALHGCCTELGSDLRATVEAEITLSQLERQLDVIMRRLRGDVARVLPFPAPSHRQVRTRPLRRWVAVAAAAGFVVGLCGGRLLRPVSPAGTPRDAAHGTAPYTGSSTLEADDQMLIEIDAALARSRGEAFRVLDALTPRIANARARGGR